MENEKCTRAVENKDSYSYSFEKFQCRRKHLHLLPDFSNDVHVNTFLIHFFNSTTHELKPISRVAASHYYLVFRFTYECVVVVSKNSYRITLLTRMLLRSPKQESRTKKNIGSSDYCTLRQYTPTRKHT